MKRQTAKSRKIYLTIGAAVGWIAVALQLYLIIANKARSVFETIIQFFSYFTILTNILVAWCFTVLLMKSGSGFVKFFIRPKVLTAITVYITIVGIVYNVILRYIWDPKGLQFIVDELLHSFIPVFFILYWWIFVPKHELKWADTLPWLIYPFVYLLYVLTRGAFSGLYPYPFINVDDLGYYKVFLNSSVLLIAFLILSLLFVAIGKIAQRASQ